MPLRVNKYRNRLHHVNLFLLYDDGTKEDGTENLPTGASNQKSIGEAAAVDEPKYHYILIRNLPALLRQDTHAMGTIHVCPY